MSTPLRRNPKRKGLKRWIGASAAATLATAGVVALRHALETPQLLKSQLPGEALLYRWRQRSIFYQVLGSPDAMPLVLLHTPALGASAHEMRYIMSPLAQTYRVYALDLLGFGLSDRPALEYSAGLYNALCQDFLRDVVKQPSILVASGLSCNYAIAVAASAPELCTSLILLTPLAFQGNVWRRPLQDTVEAPLIKALLYPLLSTRAAFLIIRGYKPGSYTDFACFYKQTHQLGAEHAVMAWVAGKLAEDTTQSFAALKQPVLMVWGSQALESPRAIASMHRATTLANPMNRPREVQIIQDAGLSPHEEQPGSVVAILQRWLSEALTALPAQAETNKDCGILPAQRTEQNTPEPVPQPVSSTMPQARRETTQRPPEKSLNEEGEPVLSTPQQSTNLVQDQLPSQKTPEQPAITAYCVKCKQKQVISHPQETTMKNGRRAVRGTCARCGTNLYRIGGWSGL